MTTQVHDATDLASIETLYQELRGPWSCDSCDGERGLECSCAVRRDAIAGKLIRAIPDLIAMAKGQEKRKNTLMFEFSDEEILLDFAAWLCDGGGEQQFSEDGHVEFSYREEDDRFAKNDARRYGPFLEKRTIRVMARKSDKQELPK